MIDAPVFDRAPQLLLGDTHFSDMKISVNGLEIPCSGASESVTAKRHDLVLTLSSYAAAHLKETICERVFGVQDDLLMVVCGKQIRRAYVRPAEISCENQVRHKQVVWLAFHVLATPVEVPECC